MTEERRTTIEECAQLAEQVATETGDGEGEIYIARKIADRIRALSPEHKAKVILSSAGITAGQSFESLSADQLAAVRREAASIYAQKYGRPLPDDRSDYIRKRYELLQIRISR